MAQLWKVYTEITTLKMAFALENMHISVPRNRIFKVGMKKMKNTQSPFWNNIIHNGIYAYIQD